MKEYQFDRRGVVGAADAVGLARITAWNVIEHIQRERGDTAFVDFIQFRLPGSVDHAGRQVKHEIDDAVAGNAIDQPGKTRTHALQGGGLRK